EVAAAISKTRVSHRLLRVKLLQFIVCSRAGRKGIEVFPGGGILRIAPCFDGGVGGILEPAIIVGDFDAVVGVGDWALLRSGGLGEKRRDGKGQNGDACVLELLSQGTPPLTPLMI